MHHVILKSMKCLSMLHKQKNMASPRPYNEINIAENQHLLGIRERAKSLVAFAGFVGFNHANEVRAEIGRMEAYMI